jgi:hypothetical protein
MFPGMADAETSVASVGGGACPIISDGFKWAKNRALLRHLYTRYDGLSCLPRALECPDEPLCDDMAAIEKRMCFDNKSILLPLVAEYSDWIINS